MPKRGENIYKRKDGRWEGRIPKADGKFQYVYAKTYREVKEKKRICLEDINSVATKQSASHASAEELFELWLSGIKGRVKPSTYGNYYCCMQKYVIPFFNEAGNRQITVLSVKNFVKSIRDNKSIAETTKKKNLVIFKTAIKEVMKGVSDYSAILEAVKLPKTENASVQVFSINEQRLIENSVQRSDDIIAYGIILCFYTGIRLGELCALKWGDFDFEAGVMSIFRTVSRVKNFDQDEKKTMLLVGSPKSNRSARKIPLPEFMLKYSTELKSYCTDENCFVLSGTDTPIDPRTYQKLYKKLLKDAGVKYRKFHAIRHTFATRAMELGVDIKTISEILGHSNVSITLNIYTHSLMEQKKIAIDKLNNMHITYMEPISFAVINSVNS
jgi:integrase